SDAREILSFLIAQQYVEANQKLGESENSKVLFMDPKFLSEGLVDLINAPVGPEPRSEGPSQPSPGRTPKKR
ncbi:MAG: paraslipin, partial [Cyanobacteria bacterium P01_D01_bin.71]